MSTIEDTVTHPMAAANDPPKAVRFEWVMPGPLVVVSTVAAIILTIVPIVGMPKSLPIRDSIAKALVTGVIVLLLIPLLLWLLVGLFSETRCIYRRIRWHEPWMKVVESLRETLGMQQQRFDHLSYHFSALALNSSSTSIVVYKISSPHYFEGRLRVLLRNEDGTTLPTGGTLQVIDPVDGKWLAKLTVSPIPSPTGEQAANVEDGEPVFSGLLHQSASSRANPSLEARAVHIPYRYLEDKND